MSQNGELQPGVGYVVREPKPVFTDSLLQRQLDRGLAGLVLTRQHPDRVRRERTLGNAQVVWLTLTPPEGFPRASDVDGLVKLVRKFIEDHRGAGIVVLEGVEYMIASNGVAGTAAFVARLQAIVAGGRATLVIPLDPSAFSRGEWSLLTRDLRVLDPSNR